MLTGKHITKLAAILMALAVLLCLGAAAFSGQAASGGVTMDYESELFDTDSIISLNIIMDEDDWADMLENAIDEQYYKCDVEVNGTMFYSVGIRPKGNTSLSSVASDPTTDRYSFKLEFDHYIDGQTCFGLDKLILNNNYADATSMKEALIYDMFAYIGADASLYNYASISVNGEYWGVYLALEGVEDSFLLRNYGAQSGELYKPDSMEIGGGGKSAPENGFGSMPDAPGGAASDFAGPQDRPDDSGTDDESSQSESEAGAFPAGSPSEEDGTSRPDMPTGFPGEAPEMPGGGDRGGFSMSSGGADLNYIDDDIDSYSAIWDGEIFSAGDSDKKRVVEALKNISEGNDLEKYMDVDNLLRYMAVHIFSVNDDSLSGSMAHNYYLYEHSGQLNILPWDYNLSFGGMGGGDASSVVNSPIDDAFSITDFFDGLLDDEECHAQYYAYLAELVDDYVNGGAFDAFYERVRSQIDELTETDPNAFYSYDEYTAACETLYETVKLRAQSISGQLSGEIPSTEDGQRESDALVDASGIDLSVMGSMNGGQGGGNGGGAPDFGVRPGDNSADTAPEGVPAFGGDVSGSQQPAAADKSAVTTLAASIGVILLALIIALFFKRRGRKA